MRISNGEVYKHIVPIYIAGRDTPKVEMSLPAPGGEVNRPGFSGSFVS